MPAKTTHHADHNLLLGILALQMDFITREQLIAATSAWTHDKSRGLDNILLEQKALAGDTRDLLAALVQKHLAMHDDSPEKSLAAVGTLDLVRADLAAINDADVQHSLQQATSRGHSTGGARSELHADVGYLAARTLSMGAPSSDGTRFRPLRPYARGGLGEVFVAHDDELDREVALKQIREERADHPESRLRFLQEARITGGLEHPGVVPVYGLGIYADGRPFYAMRLIRGDSMKDAIDRFHRARQAGNQASMRTGESAVMFRQLLARFIDVCDAIAYAHSRGVLHRDLKPANVMLGKYGETLVVDWGLAKPIGQPEGSAATAEPVLRPASGDDSTPTAMGAAVGTPEYMSPEQAAGRLDQLGPASDVYSLGATLYCVLTGKAPFREADLGSLLQQVQRGEFSPPRQMNRQVPAALEAVCLKAMSQRPDDRYASPRDLASDIEHWLADEPVTAYPESRVQRLSRWSRRHRSWTRAAAAALLLVAVVSLIAAVTVRRSWVAEANQRQLAQEAEQRAIGNLEEAERQRALAESSFSQARRAVDYLTTLSEDKLRNVPGLQPVRQELLQAALKYYQEFLDQRGDDPALRSELASTYSRMARITDLIGSQSDALESYQKALEIRQRLAAGDPARAELKSALAADFYNMGELRHILGQSAAAEADLRKAAEIQKSLTEKHPTSDEYQNDLGETYHSLGHLFHDIGQTAKAAELFQQALDIQEPLATRHPENANYQNSLAFTWFRLGYLYDLTGRRDNVPKAEEAYKKSLETRKRLVEADPTRPEFQRLLAWSHNNLGLLYSGTDRMEEAEESHLQALMTRRTLVEMHPSVTEYRRDLAISYNNLGLLYENTNRMEKAEEYYQLGIESQERLVADHPKVLLYGQDVGGSYCNMGNLLRRTDEAEESLDWYVKAIDALAKVLAQEPNFGISRQFLRNAHWGRARSLYALTRYTEALGDWDKAIELDADEIRADLDDSKTGEQLRLGRAFSLLHTDDYRQAVSVLESLEPSFGDATWLLYDAACLWSLASGAAADDKQSPEAERTAHADQYAQRALALLARLVGLHYFVDAANVGYLDEDGDFEALRERSDYQQWRKTFDKP